MADNEQLILSISADTRAMQRQLDKLVGQIGAVDNSLGTAFTKAPKKIDDVTKSLGAAKFQTANLAAQFQDIAVQLQGGQSPFTVALQQGTQISQVLGQGGATGAVSLLSSAFASLLSPTSLATIAVIALGGAAVQYGAKAIGAVDDVDENLKAHAELIRSLQEAYGDAAKGIDVVVRKSSEVQAALLGLKTDEVRKNLRNLTSSLLATVTTYVQLGDAAGQFTEENNPKYKAFGDTINSLRKQFADGVPDVRAFRLAVSQIVESSSDPSVRKIGRELLDMSQSAGLAEEAIQGTSKALRNLSADALAAAEQGEAFAKSMKALSTTVSPNLDDREKILKNYTDALEKAGSTEERLAVARVRDDQLAILSFNDRKKAAQEAANEQEQALKSFQNQINSQSKQNAKTIGATPAIGSGVLSLANMEMI
ncbi:Prophage tail length tape measure protein [Bradyrhizobium shewense]|uniref:Prophage tail length tape measure protein n=1 Tax=Bradyrhizobium shewense TaxID=1761772 RepID=A0A1C3W1D3_9BRAD|nr:phage tail length tape measure family protein [Bradyrhizobium shewense]SCB33822.1 Prophage tail length tape measure protein [Bradyrhizobium shewense]